MHIAHLFRRAAPCAALVLLACPVESDDDDTVAPDDDDDADLTTTYSGTVTDWSDIPVEGASVAIGEQVATTDADGSWTLEGPPREGGVQVDVAPPYGTYVHSVVACGTEHPVEVYGEFEPTTRPRGRVFVTVEGIDDLLYAHLAWAYRLETEEDSLYGYGSVWLEEAGGELTGSLSPPAGAEVLLLLTEIGRDGVAAREARLELEPLLEDEERSVAIAPADDLSPALPWDPPTDTEFVTIEVTQRLQVDSFVLSRPVFRGVIPEEPRVLPVALGAEPTRIAASAETDAGLSVCIGGARVSTEVAPGTERLVLPEFLDVPRLSPDEGARWSRTPTIRPEGIDPDATSISAWVSLWHPELEDLPRWLAAAPAGDCAPEELTWPSFLDPVPPGSNGYFTVTVGDAFGSASCSDFTQWQGR